MHGRAPYEVHTRSRGMSHQRVDVCQPAPTARNGASGRAAFLGGILRRLHRGAADSNRTVREMISGTKLRAVTTSMPNGFWV